MTTLSNDVHTNVNYFTTDNPCDRAMVDCEWYQPDDVPAVYTHKQATFYTKEWEPIYTVVLINKDLPLPDITIPNVYYRHEDMTVDNPGSIPIESMGVPMTKEFKLAIYYSPKDVEGLVGQGIFRDALLDPGTISKKRNLTGMVKTERHNYKITDMYGMFNTKLDEAMKSVAIDNPYKGLVESLGYSKSDMWTFAVEKPNDALLYAIGDVMFQGDMFTKKVDQTNRIISEALDCPALFAYDNFPASSGALVAKTFEGWLMHKYPRLYACTLTLSDSVNDKSWYILRDIVRKEVPTDINTIDDHNRKLRGNDQIVHGLGMGSISNYAIIGPQSGLTSVYNAVVQGGRCVNEEPHVNPYHNRITNVYDPDNSSCYGSALRKFDMPFGIPELVGFDRDDTPYTLGEFMDKNGDELVANLYQIFVTGTLPFRQDLVHSKCDLSTSKILSTLLSGKYFDGDTEVGEGTREINTAHVGGSFELNTKEITLGVITHDVWTVLNKVCSKQEMKGIRNLKVTTVAGYRKSDELSIDDWCSLMEDPNKRGIKSRGKDSRTHHWCRLPLELFVGQFVEYRRKVKKLPGGNEKGTENYLLQTAVKLFVNTTYGCLASPYFPMGNTIIANNITARARTGGWMLSKALLLVQLITDGGLGSGNRVATLKTGSKRPSLSTLSDRTSLLKHRGIQTKPLMTDSNGKPVQIVDWLTLDMTKYDERCKELDRCVNDVVTKFWATWNLEPLFDVECKYENSGETAVYFGNADYLIHNTVQGYIDAAKGYKSKGVLPGDSEHTTSVVKCRGTRSVEHPKQAWLLHLLNPSKYPNPKPDYSYSMLIGVSEWQANPHPMLMPGDSTTKTTIHIPYRSGFLAETHAQRIKDNDTLRKQTTRFKKTREHGHRFGYAKLVDDGKLSNDLTPSKLIDKRVVTDS